MNSNKLASTESVKKTTEGLHKKGFQSYIVKNGSEALQKIKKLIPEGASVMNGSSVTLEQIGFTDYLKSGKHPWIDLHGQVNAENEPAKRSLLRRQAAFSDYYLGSIHALTQNGDFIVASNTGSQLPHIVFTSPNLIFVVSTKKIVPDLSSGMKRLEEHVFPLENQHMKELYNAESYLSKIVIFKKDPAYLNRKINFILVSQNLGF